MSESYGIDVSHYQGSIRWEQVALTNKDFAIIKATEGSTWRDKLFRHNWDAAKGSGLRVGAYHYFRPGIDPKAQAQNFYDAVGDLGDNDIIPWIDVEDEHSGINGPAVPLNQLVRELDTCINLTENLFGTPVGIYTGQWFWNRLPSQIWTQDAFPLWCAYWFTDQKPHTQFPLPNGWTKYAVHQYTSKGRVPGIVGNVDLNYAPDLDSIVVGGSIDRPSIGTAIQLLEEAIAILKETI